MLVKDNYDIYGLDNHLSKGIGFWCIPLLVHPILAQNDHICSSGTRKDCLYGVLQEVYKVTISILDRHNCNKHNYVLHNEENARISNYVLQVPSSFIFDIERYCSIGVFSTFVHITLFSSTKETGFSLTRLWNDWTSQKIKTKSAEQTVTISSHVCNLSWLCCDFHFSFPAIIIYVFHLNIKYHRFRFLPLIISEKKVYHGVPFIAPNYNWVTVVNVFFTPERLGRFFTSWTSSSLLCFFFCSKVLCSLDRRFIFSSVFLGWH